MDNERLVEAINRIIADEELKNHAKRAVFQPQRRKLLPKALIPAASLAVLVFGITGILWAFFTPTSIISVDVNPSVELSVNCFERVIFAEGFNEDGEKLAKNINVRFMHYADAVESILKSDDITDYLSRDEELHISVAALSDSSLTEKMLENIEKSAVNSGNVYCHGVGADDVSAAHALGLSCGKYRAYLEVSALYPDISADEAKDMTMRELHDMLDEHGSAASAAGEASHGSGHHYSHGHGHASDG